MIRKAWVTLLTLLFCLPLFAQNAKPFTIPELRLWNGSSGQFIMDDKVKILADPSSKKIAEIFIRDYYKASDTTLTVSSQSSGKSIYFGLDPELFIDHGTEAYSLSITPTEIQVMANDLKGLYWGSRTLLQLLEQSERIPAGEAIDYPEYEIRGFMLDVGRKFFPLDYLRDIIQLMSYYKMNTFHIHLNDNGFPEFYNNNWHNTQAAFRLESDTFPGLTSKDGYYTKEEFRQLQIDAIECGITIIPEFDSPAHTLAFSRYMPQLGSEEYGLDHLDLFEPKTYQFMDALWAEYIGGDNPVFIGEYAHIGTDEYSNKNQAIVEQFRHFTNHYIQEVERHGKKAALWGALTHAQGDTPVQVEDVLMYVWYNGYADPSVMMDLGYDIISIPDSWVYIVPAAGYYHDYLDLDLLYNKWTPAQIGEQKFDERHPQIRGGMYAVWNDHPDNGISTQDVYHRLFSAMQVITAKTWSGEKASIPFQEWNTLRHKIGEGPGQNILGRPKKAGVIYEATNPKQGTELDIEPSDIGYDYRVSFDLLVELNNKGTELFTSDKATVYIADPINGRLGFRRDGYTYDFGYDLPKGEKVRVAIEGYFDRTALFINGEKISELATILHPDDAKLSKKRRWVQTLFFPLKKLEQFDGTLTNLKVEYLGLGAKG